MIQRVQSLFLFGVAAVMVAFLFFPIWQKYDPAQSEIVTVDVFKMTYESYSTETGERTLISEKDVFYISILAVLGAIVALYSIFQYTNRLRQIQLGALNSLFIAGSLGVAVYFILKADKVLAPDTPGSYLAGFYFPVIALFFNMLANRFIRRDEKLVRSADRIR